MVPAWLLFSLVVAVMGLDRNGVIWMTGRMEGAGMFRVTKAVTNDFDLLGILSRECGPWDAWERQNLVRGESVVFRLRKPTLSIVGEAAPLLTEGATSSFFCIRNLFIKKIQQGAEEGAF